MKRIRLIMMISMVLFMGIGIFKYFHSFTKIPSRIYLNEDSDVLFNFGIPVSGELRNINYEISDSGDRESGSAAIDFGNQIKIHAGDENSYEARLRLFGVLPYKNVILQTVTEKRLIPLGIPVGMYGKMEGISVQETGEFMDAEGNKVNPSKSELYPGDYILSYNDTEADKKREFVEFLEENKDKPVSMTVKRNGVLKELNVTPVLANDGKYKIGAWIRDSVQGIGTITFTDELGNYSALGHGVNDAELNRLINIERGSLYCVSIMSIHKGEQGHPGDIIGVIQYTQDQKIGTIENNSETGISGRLSEEAFMNFTEGKKAYTVGYKEEVMKGKAYILYDFGEGQREYEISIEDIRLTNKDKGLVIKVTDPELLELTGGIIQGMSGSPIIQNDKIIGAVTHVFVNNPTKGYGIFVEQMLNQRN